MDRYRWLIYVALAAMLFASKGIFGKLLYQRGVGFEVLVTVRALFAMPLFAWMAFRRTGPRADATPRVRGRAFLAAVIAGIVFLAFGNR